MLDISKNLKYFFILPAALSVAAIIALALWQRNFLFAAFVLVACFLLFTWGNRRPNIRKFTVDEHGVHIENSKSTSYDQLFCFSVDKRHGEFSAIFLRYKRSFLPSFHLLAYTDDLPRIITVLAQYLAETEYEESPIDTVEKLIRF